MDLLLSICLGLGLSAACGLRVFVPLWALSLAAQTGHVQLASNFAWIGSTPAFWAFTFAMIFEVGGYFIPWLDHFLDMAASPAAVIAGVLITASIVTGMSPFLKWTLALIAGGGLAGAVQAGTVTARGLSLAGTGGLANPLVALAELGGAAVTSAGAILAPVLTLGLLAACGILLGRRIWKLKKARTAEPAQGT